MARAIVFVLDSFGIGGAPDAQDYNDLGANTLGHISEFCAAGAADRKGLRKGPLYLPNMSSLGLLEVAKLASGDYPIGMARPERLFGLYGAATEVSRGKDTPSGHWEIAGTPVLFDWGYFSNEEQPFSDALIAEICEKGSVAGIIGNCRASGTEVLTRFGEEHIRTGYPIFYTSTDSVIQIAAHEHHFGLSRLLALCQAVRNVVDPLNIGRVIARPFVGEKPNEFARTGNRRDYSVPPPEPTLLDRLTENQRSVHAIGKISDIFAHQGISRSIKAEGNMKLVDATIEAMDVAEDGDLIFTNLVDFDMLYGHRRDVAGYAAALEDFDGRLADIHQHVRPGDLIIITADHGCDPTWRGTDHTRERVPILSFGPGLATRNIGIRSSFADIGETIAAHLGIAPGAYGRSFL